MLAALQSPQLGDHGRRAYGPVPHLPERHRLRVASLGPPHQHDYRSEGRDSADGRGGVYALIDDPDGPIRRQVARSTDDITGRMPTPDEARELGLPPGVPVFRVLRTVYDTAGRPLEVQDSVAAADRHQFRYEVEMR